MTELQFEILDELYFVISFNDLKEKLRIDEYQLKQELQSLLELDYIKCFRNVSDEIPPQHLDFENNFQKYHYLASKEGLFAHNSR